MKMEQYVAIAVRLFAIGLAIYSIKTLPGMIAFYHQEGTESAMYAFIGISILILFIAAFLWKFPLSTASKIIPRAAPESSQSYNWSEQGILTCGFIILGVYFLYYAVSDSIYWFYIWHYSQSVNGIRIELSPFQVASIITTVFEFFIAIALILGSRGVANIIKKLRHAGTG